MLEQLYDRGEPEESTVILLKDVYDSIDFNHANDYNVPVVHDMNDLLKKMLADRQTRILEHEHRQHVKNLNKLREESVQAFASIPEEAQEELSQPPPLVYEPNADEEEQEDDD